MASTPLSLDVLLNPKINRNRLTKELQQLQADIQRKPIILDIDISAAEEHLSMVEEKLSVLEERLSTPLEIAISTQHSVASLERLEKVLHNVNEEMLQSPEEEIEQRLKKFRDDIQTFQSIANGLSSITEEGIAARDAMRDIAVQTGATGEELLGLRDLAEEAFKNGIGKNVAEAIHTIGTAKAALGSLFNNRDILTFTHQAAALAQVFGKDVNEVISKSGTFITQFGLDATQAGDLLSLAMQEGNAALGDVLETLESSSQLFQKAGYSAEQFVGIISKGTELGVAKTQDLADAIQEMQSRLASNDIGVSLVSITSPITEQLLALKNLAAEGSLSIAEFAHQSATTIQEAFANGSISKNIHDQLIKAIGGSTASKIGTELYSKIFSADIDENAIREKAALAGSVAQKALGPISIGEKFVKDLDVLKTAISEAFAPFIAGSGEVLSTILQFAPAFEIFIKNSSYLKELLPRIATGFSTMLTAATGPVGLAIAGIAALTVALAYFFTQTETGREVFATAMAYITAFVSNAGEILSAFAEVAASYLDISSWLSGENELREKAKERLTKALTSALQEAGNNIDKHHLANAIAEATEIKGNLDKNNALQKLIDQFKNAKDAAEKNNLAKAIQEQVPGALQGIQSMTDANGKLHTVYDINIEKAEEFANAQHQSLSSELQSKQEAFRKGIATLGDEFDKNREKQISLQNAIVEGAKNKQDVTDLRREYQEMEKDVQANADELVAMVQRGRDLGIITSNTEDIAAALGFSGEKATILNAAFAKAVDTAQKAADGIKDYGKSFAAAKQESEALNTSLATRINGMKSELRNANLTKEERKGIRQELQKTNQFYLKNAKVLEQQRIIEANTADNARGTTVRQKDILDKKLAQIEHTKALRDVEQEIAIVSAGRSKTVFDEILAQKRLIETLREKQATIDKAAKEAAESQERRNLKQQSADLQHSIELAQQGLPLLELKANIDSKALAQKLGDLQRDYRQKTIEFNIKLGLEDEQSLVDLFDDDLSQIALQRNRLQAEFDNLDFNLLATSTPEEEASFRRQQKEVVIQLQELADKELTIKTNRNTALDTLRKKNYEAEKAVIEREEALLERKLGKEKKFWDELFSLREQATKDSSTAVKSAILDGLDRQEQEALERLGLVEAKELTEQEKAKIAIQEEFAKKRAQIEEDFRRQELIRQEQLAGERLAVQNAEDVRRLESKKRLLEFEKKSAEERGDTNTAQKLSEQLTDISDELQEKSDTILTLSAQLQDGLTEMFENMFSGNEEGMKDSMRKTLATIAGFLQQLATTAVLEIVLASPIFKSLAALAGPFAPAVLAGATALISGAINALLSPILSSVLSFSTGGRIDEPTLAVIGDGARLGGSNREWVLRDDQLRSMMGEVVAQSNTRTLAVLSEIRDAMGAERIVGVLRGQDVLLATKRAERAERERYRGFANL